MKKVLATLTLLFVLALSVTAEEPKTDTTKKVESTPAMKDTTAVKAAPWTTTTSGLKWRDKVVGKGTEAKMTMPVLCHYTVWLSDSTGTKGKLVQTSKEGQPLQCTLGVRLISGWSEGMVGMKEGGTRELIVHPKIGYGAQSRGEIPANSTLYFEIDFLNEVKQ